VKNTIDFDEIVAHAINRQKRKARKNKLAVPGLRLAATPWKLG